TSMMTPPFSISARPVFRRRLVVLCPLFCDIGLPSSGGSYQLSGISFQPSAISKTVALRLFYSRITFRGTPDASAELRSTWTGQRPVTTRALALHELCEHLVRIDGYE